MSFNYNELLRQQLYELKNQHSELDAYTFIVDSEQSFIKYKDLEPNTIYVLTKLLQNEIQIGINSQPIQIFILSEQNSLDVVKSFFSELANEYNWKIIYNTDTWIKQQYNEPVVLSNFNTIDYGYRSVLYMTCNLFIMEDIVDLKDLYIDDVKYTVVNFNISYTMSPDTQQFSSDFISKSVKSVSSMGLVITIPAVSSDLMNKVLGIMNETDTETTDDEDSSSFGGNENFYFDFYLGEVHFEDKIFKLTSADFGTAVNNAPVVRLGFAR